MIRSVRMADPELLPPGHHPTLDAPSERCEAPPAFQATCLADHARQNYFGLINHPNPL
jgi:hypothetical protein